MYLNHTLKHLLVQLNLSPCEEAVVDNLDGVVRREMVEREEGIEEHK